ncbi:hypothetical protein BCR36DRAFT_586753 [Piromyces finnis]|uniref:Uncharacterized protein n=1 Tax=Piromyces finnis TaxID=1754191 RepID=A0A1Y1V0C9_9FUNG|nr:hypothetical protein BCR36DRAFT_586753 [Piromyces finnis]|eukprot:ORX43272.1 hypothetical protein BCR36DRAFT_586753 [Piromyces finnis]
MLNSKIESDDSKFINGSHSLRLNVIIDYIIEKDILINGEVKSKEEVEEENKKKNIKNTKKKDKKKKKDEDDDTNYYFSYCIAGKIDGETDVIQYSDSTFSTFHDIDINIDFLKNLYSKQVEIKIWKLIPNSEKSTSNEHIHKQIRTKKLNTNNRKSICIPNQLKLQKQIPSNINQGIIPNIKENKSEKNSNNEMDDNESSNQSSLINYNFSLIPIKPVYDSLQQLNFPFSNIRSTFSNYNSKYKNKFMNTEQLRNHISGNENMMIGGDINNRYNGGRNELWGNHHINILNGDYVNEFDNTIHIVPHPHHFMVPERYSRIHNSYSRGGSPIRSSSNNRSRSRTKSKKRNSNSKKDEEKKNSKSSKYGNKSYDCYYDEELYPRKGRSRSRSKSNNRSNNRSRNNSRSRSNVRESGIKNRRLKNGNKDDKNNSKSKGSRKGRDKLSKRKEEDQYEMIGKMTLDICKLFFDEYEVEKKLDYPIGEVKYFGFKLSLSEPLLSKKQRKFLNPIAIEIVSAKSMPPKPTTNKVNYATIAPTYCKFSFIDNEKEYKCFEECRKENNKIIFNSVHLLLSGNIKEEDLFNTLVYKKLNIEIHDRDYEVPKDKKYISNKFDYVESYRTTYIPNIIYGVASFSLAPLVTGIKELTLTAPVETNYHIKDKGTDFVDSVNYIEYGTSLRIKVSMAYPILKNSITNINEITNFKFSRIIIIADKNDNQSISSLIKIISEFNIKEFFNFELEQKKKMSINDVKLGKKDELNNKLKNKKVNKLKENPNDDKKTCNNNTLLNESDNENKSIDVIENFDIESFRIDKEHINNPELGVITGFHIYDEEHHMIFLEGPKNNIQTLRDILNSNDFLKFKTFHSPKLTFYKRLWTSFYISPIYIHLKDNIPSLLLLNDTYLKCHTPKTTLETLKLLEIIIECNSMEEINSKLLFPTYEQLSSLIGTVGQNVTTYEFLLQLSTHQKQEITSYYTPDVVEESVTLSQKKEKTNNSKKIDNNNYLYLELIKKRLYREPNYIKQNIDKFHNLQCQQRERVYGNEGIPYNYSIQYLNSSELRKKMLQEEYSKYIKVLIHSYNKKYNSQNFEIYKTDK